MTPESEWYLEVLSSVFAGLEPLRRAGAIRHLFFMRKAPALRIRIQSRAAQRLSLFVAIRSILAQLHDRDVIRESYLSCYEPEFFRFGGQHATTLAHRYFTFDSYAWCEHAKLASRGDANIGTEIWSVAQLTDLFLRVLDDAHEEVWDVWCNIARLHGFALIPSRARPPELTFDSIRRSATPAEMSIMDQCREANARYARGLQRARRRGLLLHRFRLILPFMGLFHWNRYGLGMPEREVLCRSMLAAFDSSEMLSGGN